MSFAGGGVDGDTLQPASVSSPHSGREKKVNA